MKQPADPRGSVEYPSECPLSGASLRPLPTANKTIRAGASWGRACCRTPTPRAHLDLSGRAFQIRLTARAPPNIHSTSSSSLSGFVSGPPPDGAANAWELFLRNRAVREQGIDGRPEVLARHRNA